MGVAPGSPAAGEGQTGPGPTPPTDARLLALVLKLLKMATGMRALLDTVVQALPQVGQQLLDPGPGSASRPRGGHYSRPQDHETHRGGASLDAIHSLTRSSVLQKPR